MNPEQVFQIGNLMALCGWALLVLGLAVARLRRPSILVARFAIPGLLGLAYGALIFVGFRESSGGGFGSIAQVRALFASDAALTAGWLHYLAFDLFVGSWQSEDAERKRVPALLLVPCLALTFLLGPLGLLLYLALRSGFARRGAQPREALS